jgi:predicted DNA-binding transcriptional regulator YafY
MPKNKNALDRFNILNECFRNDYHLPVGTLNPIHKGCWTKEELVERIYQETGKTIHPKTISNDIRDMRTMYNAPIKSCRGFGWKYEDPKFSISENPLTDQDYQVLSEITEILKNYSGFKYFEDAETIISKIEDNKLHSDYQRIQLDTLPAYSGLQFISKIKEAVFEMKAIKLINKEFEKDEKEIVFHPYILKEYNNRWFVLGYANKKAGKYGKLWLLALDRIVKIHPSEVKYRKPDKKELRNYFTQIFGVTNYQDIQTEKVIIKIEKFRSNYFKTKPIHKSQKLIKEEADYDCYSLKLKLNKEIISLFLSFGKDLEVVEPTSFRDDIKDHVNEMHKLYQV